MRYLFLLLLLIGCKGRSDKPWLTPTQRATDQQKTFLSREVFYNTSPESDAELDARLQWEAVHPARHPLDQGFEVLHNPYREQRR